MEVGQATRHGQILSELIPAQVRSSHLNIHSPLHPHGTCCLLHRHQNIARFRHISSRMVELLFLALACLDRAATTATASHDRGAACRFRISWAQILASARVSLSGPRLVHHDRPMQVMAVTRCRHRHRTTEEHHMKHVKGLQRDVMMLTMDNHTLYHDLHRRKRSQHIDQPSML